MGRLTRKGREVSKLMFFLWEFWHLVTRRTVDDVDFGGDVEVATCSRGVQESRYAYEKLEESRLLFRSRRARAYEVHEFITSRARYERRHVHLEPFWNWNACLRTRRGYFQCFFVKLRCS